MLTDIFEQKPTILIVEDEPANAQCLSVMLHEYNPVISSTGEDALLQIKQKCPDLVLLDIILPGIDGYEVCRRIKAKKSTHDIPVVLLSCLSELGNELKGFEAGAIDYIAKPFSESIVKARIKNLITLGQFKKSQIHLLKTIQNENIRLNAIIDNANEGIVLIDRHGLIELFNPAAEKITHYSKADILGKNISLLASESDRSAHDEYVKQSHLHGSRIINNTRDIQGCRADGSQFPMELNVGAINLLGDRKFVGFFRDITQRKQIQNELKIAKENAEKASRAKSDFLSSMSHELRTPMNAILGFAQLLNYKQTLSNPMQINCVNQIMNAGEHLLTLLNDVLNLAKIESGGFQMNFETVDVEQLLSQCFPLIEIQALKKNISIKFQKTNISVRADAVRLKQALLNLLSNAIKYNHQDGEVQIYCQETVSGQLQIHIKDSGVGIIQEKQQDLFEPFSRLGAEYTDIEGTGIGLTICKHLVTMMNGQLDYKSQFGVGSDFWIELPVAYEAANINFVDQDQNKTRFSARGCILYVEDNPTNLKLMEMIIDQLEGVEMLSAHNAEFGIELAQLKQPDMIIMDINLPGMNGFEALKAIQADNKIKHIPVIALSANSMPDDKEQGLKAGFLDYLAKPVDINIVISALNRFMTKIKKAKAEKTNQ